MVGGNILDKELSRKERLPAQRVILIISNVDVYWRTGDICQRAIIDYSPRKATSLRLVKLIFAPCKSNVYTVLTFALARRVNETDA